MKTKTNKSRGAKPLSWNGSYALSHEDIEFAAYCLWDKEGRPPGHDLDYWLRAEALMKQADQPPQTRSS